MQEKHPLSVSERLLRVILALFVAMLAIACANVGNPEGGPYDMTPPRLVKAEPARGALEVDQQRMRLTFDEYIKLSQQDKIIISPAHQSKPSVMAVGRSVLIRFEDSLKPNTTYSVYFDDAIVDNNEDNPLEDFYYTFSTGKTIDSMQIGGMVLDARTLEPVADLLIGALWADPAVDDSLALKRSFSFVSKTNKLGAFTIRGLRDSLYQVYALKDDDSDYKYNGTSEGFAFAQERWRTAKLDSIRVDTIKIDSIVRRDTLTRDSLVRRPYTYYYPNDLVLRYFVPHGQRMGIDKYGRADSLVLQIDFLHQLKALPRLSSLDKLNAPADSLYVGVLDGKKATYWLRDQSLIGLDSLRFALEYDKTDSLLRISTHTDTLTFYKPRATRERPAKSERVESPLKITFSSASDILSGTRADSLILTSSLPLASVDRKRITLRKVVDSTTTVQPYELEQDTLNPLRYYMLFDRQYGARYKVKIDSAGLMSLYGHASDSLIYEQRMSQEADLGALQIRLKGLDTKANVVIELLDKSDKLLLIKLAQLVDSAEAHPKVDSLLSQVLMPEAKAKAVQPSGGMYTATFGELKPAEYYLRMYLDEDGDGQWSSGRYPSTQPEPVYYSPATYAVKKGFTTDEVWEPLALPLDKQKPEALRKAKPETKPKREDKNIEYYRKHPRRR